MSAGPGRFLAARVRARDALAPDVVRLALDVPGAFHDAHAVPGQFALLRAAPSGLDGPFALASAPHERDASFFVRATDPLSTALVALHVGDPLEATLPTGAGFDLRRAEGRPVVFVATGTGIAPVRAAIETALLAPGRFGPLRLFYGVRARDALLVPEALARWRSAGLAVRWAASRTPDPEAIEGWVQRAIDAEPGALRAAVVVVAGQPALAAELRARVAAEGGDAEDVIDNLGAG